MEAETGGLRAPGQKVEVLLTTDSGHWDHFALHHVVDVEELVLQAGGHHLLAVGAEAGLVHRKPLQVDALDLGVGLPVHLKE